MGETNQQALLDENAEEKVESSIVSVNDAQIKEEQVNGGDPLDHRTPEEEAEDIAFAANALMTLVKPVTLTMILATFMVVHLSNPQDQEQGTGVNGYLVSDEQGSSSESDKAEAAFYNGLVFVAAIIVVTFLLLLCYKFNWLKAIYAWLAVSVVALLFLSGGFVMVRTLYVLDARVDIYTFYIVMYNFAIVGVISVFTDKLPHVLKQIYLVLISAIMAFLLSLLPEWTTWSFLILLAIYDLCAVLTPCGPLKCLIEMSQERDDPIPALLYEAKTVVPNPRDVRDTRGKSNLDSIEVDGTSEEKQVLQENAIPSSPMSRDGAAAADRAPDTTSAPIPPDWHAADPNQKRPAKPISHSSSSANIEPTVAVVPAAAPAGHPASNASPATQPHGEHYDGVHEEEKTVKLGLGDFVMYSLLVGRAAAFSLSTFAACFVAIIAGLGLTLVCLAVFRKALPALPFSIFFAAIFYFTTRLIVWPFLYEFIRYPIVI